MTTHEATLVDYRNAVKVIEDEFDEEWLIKIITESHNRGSWLPNSHPIPRKWQLLKDGLSEYENTGELKIKQEYISLASFSSDLAIVRELKNYERVIKSRLKNINEFPKVSYEIYVGALSKRSGYNVEFLIPGRHRSADLGVFFEGEELFFECKRRDGYVIPTQKFNKGILDQLRKSILNLRHDLPMTYEVLILITSFLDQHTITGLVKLIEPHLQAGEEGLFSNRFAGAILRPLPPPPIDLPGLYLASTQNYEAVEGTVAVDKSGNRYIKDQMLVKTYFIDSHKLKYILNTFNKARKQIPKDEIGFIYIDVDVSGLEQGFEGLYLELLSNAIQSVFSPNENTRIGGVVVTTNPRFVEYRKEGKRFIRMRRSINPIRNPYCSISNDFNIPGESFDRL